MGPEKYPCHGWHENTPRSSDYLASRSARHCPLQWHLSGNLYPLCSQYWQPQVSKTSSLGCDSALLSLRCFFLVIFFLLIPPVMTPKHCNIPPSADALPMHHVPKTEMNLLIASLEELFHIFLPSLGHWTHQLCLLSRPDTTGDMAE